MTTHAQLPFMQPASIIRTFAWIVIFLGSLSVVALIRRNLTPRSQVAHVGRTVSTQALYAVYQTRSLVMPD